MATFVLIPGAGGAAWYWHRVVTLLERAGHEAIAVDLPGNAGLPAYADLVAGAIGDRTHVTLVAQSLGGFTAPLVCERLPHAIDRLVFLNAMIPNPGETPGAWWGHTGSQQARQDAAVHRGYAIDFDLDTYFLHDVPPEVTEAGAEHQRPESDAVFETPADFKAWPDIPIHVITGRDDRFFPAPFQARVARERLGKAVEEVPGGHLASLSHPWELTEKLLSYL